MSRLFVLAFLAPLAFACDTAPESAADPTRPPLVVEGEPDLDCRWAEVLSVADGDTFDVRIDGVRETIRIMGVDAPELHHPQRGEDPFAAEAAAFAEDTLGEEVCLEPGIIDRDPFDRLLRYAWLPGGTLFNEELLRAGLATINTFPPDVKYVERRYLPAQQEARDRGAGLWADLPFAGTCDDAYPGVCIPPPPPDLDCADVEFRRFTVLPPDPHNFDIDGNGVGCES